MSQVATYTLLSLKVLRVALPVAIGAIGMAEEALKDQYEPAIEFTEHWVDAANEAEIEDRIEDLGDRHDHLEYSSLRPAEGASLRAFHRLLAETHGTWQPGDAVIGPAPGSKSTDPILRRVVDKKMGDVLWVCPTHYKEYDPGLPVFPHKNEPAGTRFG